MNAVGIDVSKGKSTVAILRPFGEVVAVPYEVFIKSFMRTVKICLLAYLMF